MRTAITSIIFASMLNPVNPVNTQEVPKCTEIELATSIDSLFCQTSSGKEAFDEGNYVSALAHYSVALELAHQLNTDSIQAVVHYGLSRTFAATEKTSVALFHAQQAVKFAPEDTTYSRNLHKLNQ